MGVFVKTLQNVANSRSQRAFDLLEKSQRLWYCLWLGTGFPDRNQACFHHIGVGQYGLSSDYLYHGLQNLQKCFVSCEQDSRRHPFKQYFNVDVTLPVEQVRELVLIVTRHLNMALAIAKSSIMVENVAQSLKFAGGMYALTYIGKMFNGLTLIIIAWVTIFSAPKIYRENQEKIDEALLPIKEKVDDLLVKLKATTTAKNKIN